MKPLRQKMFQAAQLVQLEYEEFLDCIYAVSATLFGILGRFGLVLTNCEFGSHHFRLQMRTQMNECAFRPYHSSLCLRKLRYQGPSVQMYFTGQASIVGMLKML